VYSAANGVEVNVGPGTLPETFVFSNNLWYASDAPADSAPELPVAETDAVIGMDPQLMSNEQPTITQSSPAAGQGAMVAEASADYAGRCWASPPSIGAYEIE
jgi:hypothetical protein